MEENKTIITEAEAKEVATAVENEVSANPTVETIRKIESGETTPELESEVVSGIGSDSGDTIFPEDEFKGVDLYEAAMEDMNSGEAYMANASSEIADKFNIPIEDVRELFNISNRIKKGEKFSIYNALPEKVKDIIKTQIADASIPLDSQSKSIYCDLFMDEFRTEFIDKYLDKQIIDFNQSVKETIGSITNLTDIYAGHIRYMMEVTLKEKAAAAATPEAKAIYLGCSQAFTDSYTYSKMINVVYTRGRVRRKLYKENFKFKRICEDFDYLNKETKFSIRNVGQLYTGMVNNVQKELNLTDDDCKAFVILFIRSAELLDLSKVTNAMYVYYTMFNILNLRFDTNHSKFYLTVMNNIKKVFNVIWEIRGNERRFDIAPDIEWQDDVPSEDDLKSFEESLTHLDNDESKEEK